MQMHMGNGWLLLVARYWTLDVGSCHLGSGQLQLAACNFANGNGNGYNMEKKCETETGNWQYQQNKTKTKTGNWQYKQNKTKTKKSLLTTLFIVHCLILIY